MQQLLVPAKAIDGIYLNRACLTVSQDVCGPFFSRVKSNGISALDMLMNGHFSQLDKYAGSCIF
jgi:hypothetical protein